MLFGARPTLRKILGARAGYVLTAELLEIVRYRLANPQPGVKVSLDEL